MSAKFKLYANIDTESSLPVGLSIGSCHPQTEMELDEIVNHINTLINWLSLKREDEIRFYEHRKSNDTR